MGTKLVIDSTDELGCFMKTILSFFGIIFFAAAAHTESAAELTCRAQAKEIAVQTYSSCVTQARNSQIEQIRADYQKELAAVKSKYDQELKKLSGKSKGTKSAKAATSGPTVKEVKAPKAAKGVAKQLPTREAAPESLPVQNVAEGIPVVAVKAADSGADANLEKEASEADQIDIIDMPVE